MEVESIGDANGSPKMNKQVSNDSLELLEAKARGLAPGLCQPSCPRLRETASSFEPPALGVPVPQLVPKAGHGRLKRGTWAQLHAFFQEFRRL